MVDGLRFRFVKQVQMTCECESTLLHYLHLLVNAHGYVHCSLDAVVDIVNQLELVIAIRNPTELRYFKNCLPAGFNRAISVR